jgi:acrylyl-CoA reductase (NADPH)
MSFRAIYLESATQGEIRELSDLSDPRELRDPSVPSVTIDVAYSTINYKDALALTGKAPVVRRFPMVPGIDLAGTVRSSGDPRWREGDEVVVNGFGLGEDHWGGLAQRARVPGDWLLRKPSSMTLYDTMAVGTAGYTAALCVLAIEQHGIAPGAGDVLVTGATGGVGSLAIMILAASGYRVVASTGKPHEREYLQNLGAADVVDRHTLSQPGKPLQRERWAAAVDTVGSHTLANVCAQTKYEGVVAACGLAQGMDFPATVAPFILRGVTLAGVNSVLTPRERRERAWDLIERLVDRERLAALSREIGLAGAAGAAKDVIDGAITGRLVVNVNR